MKLYHLSTLPFLTQLKPQWGTKAPGIEEVGCYIYLTSPEYVKDWRKVLSFKGKLYLYEVEFSESKKELRPRQLKSFKHPLDEKDDPNHIIDLSLTNRVGHLWDIGITPSPEILCDSIIDCKRIGWDEFLFPNQLEAKVAYCKWLGVKEL